MRDLHMHGALLAEIEQSFLLGRYEQSEAEAAEVLAALEPVYPGVRPSA